MKNRSNFHGFTLIELLIVVAIIAILAAIAVPNFLEAQVRAKVSRVKADQRSLATAIESYAIDYNRAPMGAAEITVNNSTSSVPAGPYPTEGYILNYLVWAQVTTPIAYMTSVPYDPFYQVRAMTNPTPDEYAEGQRYHKDQHYDWRVTATNDLHTGEYYVYGRSGMEFWYGDVVAHGHTWSLGSNGPMGTRGSNGTLILLTGYTSPTTRPPISYVYDPTNGTMSFGGIVRTNQGIITDGEEPIAHP